MAEGMDVFALALRLTTEGAEQMESTLEHINLKGAGAATSLTSLAGVVGALAAAFVVLEKSSEFLSASVSAGAEQEQTFVRMGVAVQNAGQSFASARPEIEELLEKLAGKSTFQVDQLGGAFTRLVQLTGNVGASMQKLAVVTDFAAGRNIDLESAANLVGRAMNGNATMLNRMLGLHGDAAQALATLTERYKGNAEALADVSPQVQASNAMHELMESIGLVILNEGGLKSATSSWVQVLKDAKRWVDEHREAIGDTVLAFISFGQAVGEVIAAVMVPLQGAWILINIGIYAFIDVIQTIGPLFKLVAGSVLESAVEMLSGVVRLVPGLEHLFGGVLKTVGAVAKQLVLDGTTALAANDAAFLDNVASLYRVDAITGDYILKHKDLQKTLPATTEELEKELGALADLDTLHVITADQIGRLRDLYVQLQARIDSGTLSVVELATAYKALASAQNLPLQLLGANLGIDTPKLGPGLDKMQHDLNEQIGASMKKGEKEDLKAWHDRAIAFAATAEGQLLFANEQIQQSVQQNLFDQWANLGPNLAGTIADSLSAGFSGGFKGALKAAEAGLGSIFSSMGKAMLLASGPLKALQHAMMNPFTSGWAIAAAGVVLIGLGAALSSAAASGGGGGGGGGSGGDYSVAGAGTATNAAQITNITLAPTSAAQAAKLPPMSQNNFTIIGANDPTIHQPIIDLINNATGRGMTLAGATG